MYGGPLFSSSNDQKLITVFSIYECLHLTGLEVNFVLDI